MLERPGIMQHKKCEYFPSPVSGDGWPKNISRTHIPCKLQSHVLNTVSMKRWGEFHLYRTAYRKFTWLWHKLLQNTHRTNAPLLLLLYTSWQISWTSWVYERNGGSNKRYIRYIHKYCIITDKKLAENSIMPYLLLVASAEAISVMSSQPNHLMNAFCHQSPFTQSQH